MDTSTFLGKANMKRLALYVLSLVSLIVGILGIADMSFFNSSVTLEILQVLLGVGGLIAAAR